MDRFLVTSAMFGLLTACCVPSARAGELTKEPHIAIDRPTEVQINSRQHVLKSIEPGVVIGYQTDRAGLRGPITGWWGHRPVASDRELFGASQSEGEQASGLERATGDSTMRRYVGAALGALVFAFFRILTSEPSSGKQEGT
jgi:hypothetical protein